MTDFHEAARRRCRALSVWQPHATLLATGLRHIETRTWQTPYRGVVLLHAAKTWNDDIINGCDVARDSAIPLETLSDEAISLMKRTWRDTLGCVLGIGWLHQVRPIPVPMGSEFDKAFGGFGEGRYGLFLRDVKTLRNPIPARGAQGLWVPGAHLIESVLGEISAA